MKYFSMFSGIGGFEYGIGNKGKCIGFSEVDKYATAIYKYHYPDHVNYRDCTKINAEELPDFDLLVGGFPCQAFSIAGKRQGFNDTRGTLFFDIARIIKVKRPKIVLLENVKGLLNHDKGKTFRVILQTLGELGYNTQWMVVNSKFFGVPQNRERTIIIGSLRGNSRPEILPFGEISEPSVKLCGYEEVSHTIHARLTADSNGTYIESGRKTQVIGNLGNGHEAHNVYSKEGIAPTVREMHGKVTKVLNNPVHSNDRLYDSEGETPSLNTAQGGNRQPKIVGVQGDLDKRKTYLKDEVGTLAANPTSDNLPRMIEGATIRRLTPTECERLQAFPDDWTKYGDFDGEIKEISDSQRYKTLGNAVTTNVIKAIMERIDETS